MKCMCAQTRPQFILSSQRVLGKWSQKPCSLQGKNPLYQKKISSEEDRTCDAASRTASPTHYQRAIPAPICSDISVCRNAEMEVPDQICNLTLSLYIDSMQTSLSTEPFRPNFWHGSHHSTSFYVTGIR